MCSVNRNKSEGSVIKITAVVNKNWDYGIYKIYIYTDIQTCVFIMYDVHI